ncbi:helix-turn-helix transcriptional regulator [Clostridium folliculivorans]|uniref:Transcriptional regulator n=1 Tax=Clostridium folliculivorans TaxID=2886038 RepID=A0A9W5Y4J5_9CLOT|nr:helix-turn-helix transcriptional regulator [Clostridium folliculivorans]GKU26531.1 transcriptional regulator [Clostridium folliculivorans]GKU29037.1 transcriptional regulator [Clostridium folliculivorans]
MDKNKELGLFLKKKRSTLRPEQFGIKLEKRRRVEGLKREEVADLAGVSLDWYVRIEQGQDVNPSVEVLLALSRVLQLNNEEKRYLFNLSDKKMPAEDTSKIIISDTLQKFLDSQNPNIAYITDSKLTIIGWNKAALKVYGNYERMSEKERNSVWRSFNDNYMKELLDNWEGHSRLRVEQLRANYSCYENDAKINEIIDELNSKNSFFNEWWNEQGIKGTPEGQKLLHHPMVGKLYLSYISFKSTEIEEASITIQMAVDDETKNKLEKLLKL